jgi:hypothetical protein
MGLQIDKIEYRRGWPEVADSFVLFRETNFLNDPHGRVVAEVGREQTGSSGVSGAESPPFVPSQPSGRFRPYQVIEQQGRRPRKQSLAGAGRERLCGLV